ncbi:carbohydrate ABC transporter permease [Vallicoccus soli]|uniref:Carbohydrate ABC transporter permease n=1 Tax=Vallicoccus soli TaxID=2339232 RepID=A0A3A3YNI1_9ACTN|nr:carbohydrate ABC transporter permease [Vallicoccus soli]RJK92951.1 carbohydrate ABC transporter permease [Vallicoccus soli]
MTTSAPTAVVPSVARTISTTASRGKKRLTSPWASLAAVVIAVLWTLPTLGLLVTSFREETDIRRTGWWTALSDPTFTLDNYREALGRESGGGGLVDYLVNSFVITVPSVVIPMVLAALAAYAFAWIHFPGRDFLFIAVFALQIVPIQVTLIPLLTLFVQGDVGEFVRIWVAHSTFALPLAVFLLHNFMRDVPAELIEAARVDGAGHVKTFFSVVLPLMTPALAAFGIFQFLWVWNDLLVALTFAGGTPQTAPMTVALANLSGTRGTDWYLLSAGAFISIVIPVVVFLALQRYFVRGLLAGSVKG